MIHNLSIRPFLFVYWIELQSPNICCLYVSPIMIFSFLDLSKCESVNRFFGGVKKTGNWLLFFYFYFLFIITTTIIILYLRYDVNVSFLWEATTYFLPCFLFLLSDTHLNNSQLGGKQSEEKRWICFEKGALTIYYILF